MAACLVCYWYWIISLRNMITETVKWKIMYRTEIWAWFDPESYFVNFFIRKTENIFHKPHYLQFKPPSCSIRVNWPEAKESVKWKQNFFLQIFGYDICLFSYSSLYIFTLLMNKCLIATVKMSGVAFQQSLLPRPAGIVLVFCSWLMEVAGVKHK